MTQRRLAGQEGQRLQFGAAVEHQTDHGADFDGVSQGGTRAMQLQPGDLVHPCACERAQQSVGSCALLCASVRARFCTRGDPPATLKARRMVSC